jgi:glycerophosphoryl diester phosphodiesterase
MRPAILLAILLALFIGCGNNDDNSTSGAGNATDDDDSISADDDSIADDDDDDDDDCDPLFPNVLVVAHRGATQYAPANTIPAIEKAFEVGADIVELDVRHTSDGHYVLMHNSSVDGTTNGTGLVEEMTLAQIQALLVDDSAYGNIHGDLRVPTLEQAMEVIDAHTKQMYLDMKTDQVEGAIQVIVDLGMEHVPFVYSGDFAELEQVRLVSSQIRIMPSSANIWGTRALLLRFDPDPKYIDVHDLGFSKRNIDLIHSRGAIAAMDALGTFDELAALGYTFGWRLMMDRGLDIIQTDYAEKLANFRDSLCR